MKSNGKIEIYKYNRRAEIEKWNKRRRDSYQKKIEEAIIIKINKWKEMVAKQ